MTAYLEIGPEVPGFLGPAALAQARDTTAFGCSTPARSVTAAAGSDDPASPAALVAWRYLPAQTMYIRYAHAACSPPALLTVIARPVPARTDTSQACCTLSDTHDPPAALIIATTSRVCAPAGNGELADSYSTALLQSGMTPLGSCRQHIPPVTGLAARIDGTRTSVTAPGGQTLFDGLLHCPPAWLAAARARRRVLIITAAGLDLTPPGTSPPGTRMTAVQHAINSGHAVAGTATITITRAGPGTT